MSGGNRDENPKKVPKRNARDKKMNTTFYELIRIQHKESVSELQNKSIES